MAAFLGLLSVTGPSRRGARLAGRRDMPGPLGHRALETSTPLVQAPDAPPNGPEPDSGEPDAADEPLADWEEAWIDLGGEG
jgi:hypothetical protein